MNKGNMMHGGRMGADDIRQRHSIRQAQALISDWLISGTASPGNQLSYLPYDLTQARSMVQSDM